MRWFSPLLTLALSFDCNTFTDDVLRFALQLLFSLIYSITLAFLFQCLPHFFYSSAFFEFPLIVAEAHVLFIPPG